MIEINNELKTFLENSYKQPKEIHLESSSRCNGNCVTCPRQGMSRFQGEMSTKLFVKAVQNVVEKSWHLDYFHFHLNGEPLYLPIGELCWRINYAKDNLPGNPILCFFTNASLMNKYKSRLILESKLDKIVFSVDGGNKETFEKMRPGLDWEIVVDNITHFMRIKKEINSSIATQTAFIPCTINKESLPAYYTLFRGLGIDDVGGSGVNNIGGYIDSKTMRLPTQYTGGDKSVPCWRIFIDLSICADGKAVVCCQDVRADQIIGDLNTQTLSEIWQGKEFETIRRLHLTKEQQKIPFCKNCDYMESFVAPEWWPK